MAFTNSLAPAVIVDIDGTLALRGDRSPFDWSRVELDQPNTPVIVIVRALRALGYEILVVSGREDLCRDATERWLHKHIDFIPLLFMRSAGDYRPDYIVKEEIYRTHIEFQWDVTLVLDDRQQTVDLWRRLGITTLQVAAGDF